MRRNPTETFVGAIMVVIVVSLLGYTYYSQGRALTPRYLLSASFNKIGDLARGSDVRVDGVKIGVVRGRSLDVSTYEAVVTMAIDSSVHIPSDTTAVITSDGFIGTPYVRLNLGRAKDMIGAGGVFEKTEDFKSIEDTIRDFIFANASGDGRW